MIAAPAASGITKGQESGELNRGSSMQLSLLHPAADSSMMPQPDWVIPEDVEISQDSELDRNIRIACLFLVCFHMNIRSDVPD